MAAAAASPTVADYEAWRHKFTSLYCQRCQLLAIPWRCEYRGCLKCSTARNKEKLAEKAITHNRTCPVCGEVVYGFSRASSSACNECLPKCSMCHQPTEPKYLQQCEDCPKVGNDTPYYCFNCSTRCVNYLNCKDKRRCDRHACFWDDTGRCIEPMTYMQCIKCTRTFCWRSDNHTQKVGCVYSQLTFQKEVELCTPCYREQASQTDIPSDDSVTAID